MLKFSGVTDYKIRVNFMKKNKLIPLCLTSLLFAWVNVAWANDGVDLTVKASDVVIDNPTAKTPAPVVDKGITPALAAAVVAATSNEAPVELSPTMKITSKAQHVVDAKLAYKMDISYPQIQGNSLTSGAKQFNQAIEKVVNNEVNQFKKNLVLDSPHMQTLPEALRKNSLRVDYDVDVVKPKNETLLSVRITFEGMQAGRAHPYHNNKVINFDLTSGKVLALDDIFKKNSKYLQLLAAYSKKTLDQKLKNDSWMVEQGTKADVKNFQNWNLQADSLLITFDEYQVAPYVYGTQEVEIPYSELKKVLSAKAPIAECAANASNCQVG